MAINPHSYQRRPKIGKMSKGELAEFQANFPLRIDFHKVEACHAYPRHEVRKMMHDFFDTIGSPVASSGSKAYFAKQIDMDLFLMGMWR